MPSTPPADVSLFTRIDRGEIPAHKVYEDSYVFAILDIFPVAEGHLLVIPKQQVAYLHELSAAAAAACAQALVKLGGALVRAQLCTAYNVLQNNGELAGQSVPHVHFHLIPKATEHSGLGTIWRSQPLALDTATQLLKRLQTSLIATQQM